MIKSFIVFAVLSMGFIGVVVLATSDLHSATVAQFDAQPMAMPTAARTVINQSASDID